MRIVHHADGTAEVNGAAVVVEPGEDVRKAAYLAALDVLAASGVTPVAATRVEPDGTEYPFTLYPGRIVVVASRSSRMRRALGSLRLGWLAAAACGCVLLTMLATVLLRANDPGLGRTGPNARRVEAGATAVAPEASVEDGFGGTYTSRDAAPAGLPAAGRSAISGASDARGGAPFAVSDLTLALFAGDKDDPAIAYIITVSANDTKPVTLTYQYSGAKAAGATRTRLLTGQRDYAVAGTIPGQAYCGGSVTMTVSTSPRSTNGSVTATTKQHC